MRRQIDFKFLAILIVLACVTAVGIHYLHKHQVGRNAESLRRYAELAESKGDLNKAAHYLGRYLGFLPNDTASLAKYGDLLHRLAKKQRNEKLHVRAFLILEQVLRRDPSRNKTRRVLVDLAMALGDLTAARGHLHSLLKSTPNNAELETLLGDCAAIGKNYRKAAKWFKEARRHAPKELDNYLKLSFIYRLHLDEAEEADKVIELLNTELHDSFAAKLAYARYWLRFDGKDEKAQKRAEAAIEHANSLAPKNGAGGAKTPDKTELYLVEAELQQVQDERDEARGTLRRGLKEFPKEVRLYLALIRMEVQEGAKKNHQAALKMANLGLKKMPGQPDLLHAKADVLVRIGKVDQVKRIIVQLEKMKYDPFRVAYLLGRMQFQNGEWGKAEEILNKMLTERRMPEQLSFSVRFLLGRCYEQLGNPDLALRSYRDAIKLDPLSIKARLGLAVAHTNLGRYDNAAKAYRGILNFKKFPMLVRQALVRVLLLDNLQIPQKNREWTEIERQIKLAKSEQKGNLEIGILEAEVLLHKYPKDLSTARSVLEKLQKKNPDSIVVWLALANLQGRKNTKKALETLDKALNTTPLWRDNPKLLHTRIQLVTGLPKKIAHSALSRLEKKVRRIKGAETNQLLDGLAWSYYQIAARSNAKRLWRELAKDQPKNLVLRLLLFDLAYLAGDHQEMQDVVLEIKKLEGDRGAYWRCGEASRIVHQVQARTKNSNNPADLSRLRQAVRYLSKIEKLRPNWYRVPALRGQIEELEGRKERAIERYQEAMRLGDRRPLIVRRLVRLLFEKRRFVESEKAVRQLLHRERTLLLAGLGKLAANTLLRNHNFDDALEFARKSISDDSKDYRDPLWLGHILWALAKAADANDQSTIAKKHRVEAEKVLFRACEIDNNAPEAWTALISFLAKTGKKSVAMKKLKHAAPILIRWKATLALAECHEAVGNLTQAEKLFVSALASKPKDAERHRHVASFFLRTGNSVKAMSLLRKLLRLPKGRVDDHHRWARRRLAILLVSGTDYRDFQSALALLQENIGPRRPNPTDLRIKAMVLATHPGHRQDAIYLCEDVSRHQALSGTDLFTLCQLYVANRQWSKAQMQLLALLGSEQGKNPIYYSYYARQLLQRKQTESAQIWLNRLVREYPNSVQTLEIKARVLEATDQTSTALLLVNKYARSLRADTAFAASLLEKLAKNSKKKRLYQTAARKLYQEAASTKNTFETALAYAQFLMRRQEMNNAIEICEKLAKRATPQQVAHVSVVVLGASEQASPAHVKQVEEWLKHASRSQPNSIMLMLALGHLHNLQGRCGGAISMYERVLTMHPDNEVALNNLALLAAAHEKNHSKALRLIKKAYTVLGPTADLLDTRGSIYLLKGDAKRAIHDLQKAIKINPSPERHFHLAQALLATRDQNAAKREFHSAIAAGLTVGKLHPLERPAFLQMQKRFDKKSS